MFATQPHIGDISPMEVLNSHCWTATTAEKTRAEDSPISVYTEGVLTDRICKALSKCAAPVFAPRRVVDRCNLQYLVTLTLKNTS